LLTLPTSPVDVPTQSTVTFVTSRLPARAAILEVGCGEGHVAQELMRLGHAVTALDANADAVARAQARGVPAVVASWPEFDCEPVDAVVFTRSLHHIGPLAEATRQAREVLKPSGVLLVEDFAFDEADEVTISWFVETLRAPRARALLEEASSAAPAGADLAAPGEFASELLAARDPVDAWHGHHHHDLHRIAAMTDAIALQFDIQEARSVPYLYRYLVPVLPVTAEAAALVEEVAREEARRGERGEFRLIGRRIAGARRNRSAKSRSRRR
jgi:SAM-dependent methyltransferase